MSRRARTGIHGLMIGLLLTVCPPAVAADADIPADALIGRAGSGTLTEGIEALETEIARVVPGSAEHDRALFALGLARALRGFEILGQAGYRYGMSTQASRLGGSFFPLASALPVNPQPEPVTLDDIRAAVSDAMAQAQLADRTLGRVRGDFALRIDIFSIRLDLNADGVAGEDESLRSMLWRGRIRVRGEGRDTLEALPVDFDRGDADWLRGYCNITQGAGQFALAHDATELFERAGHVLFPANETPHDYLKSEASPFQNERRFIGVDPLDLIAMIHLMDFPVKEPDRMEKARGHFLAAIGHSRAMWAHYDAETDNADEWVPNPKQTAAFPRAVMDDEMRGVWLRFLDDAEALLEGRVLLPFWRGDGSRGINVKRVFTEPRDTDLILWIQGSAAEPYLEEGAQLDTQIWRDLEQVFDERTFRHMFWLN